MQILITGGTGFIGTRLRQRLLDDGHQLTLLTRKPEQFSNQQQVGIRAIGSLDQLGPTDRFEAIFNLAGEGIADQRWSAKRKQVLLDSRLLTTQELLDFIDSAEQKPVCLINASAVGFYGDQGDAEVDESSPANQDFGHELCQRWENMALQAEQKGVRVCIVRIGLVVGRGGGFLRRMLLPFKMGLGGPLGNGRQWMSWVHLEDLVRLMVWLLNEESRRGIYNGTSPQPVTNREFTQTLGRCLHRPAFIPVLAPTLRIAMGEMSCLLLTGQKVRPKRALEEGFEFRFEKLEDALSDVL